MPRSRIPTVVLASAGAIFLAALWLLYISPGARLEREREALAAPPSASGAPASVATGSAAAAPTLSVDALVARQANAQAVVDLSAVLEPVRSVVVGAEVAGAVVEVAAEEHAHVREGDLLVRLDPALPGAVVERARATLGRAEAGSRLAQAELRRQQDLAARGVTSTAELERAESQASSTAAQVAEARAQLAEARTHLQKTRIVAPFSGVVSALDLDPGAYLQPGSPVATIEDLSEIEIEVGVGDRQVLALRSGDPVQVAVDVFPGEWFEGRILRVGRSPDPQTRRYPVPIRIPNADERLLPGMLGTVRFEIGEARPALRIPRRAVRREFELDYVYVLESEASADGVARARRQRVRVEPVPFQPDLVEVNQGLEGGERIAISGIRELRDGLRVRFVERGDGW